MKRIIKKILKEDRRQMYLDKIIQVMKNDFPLIKNLKYYGFYEQLSYDELNYVLSGIFGEPVKKNVDDQYNPQNKHHVVYNDYGNEIYSEFSGGSWYKWEYDENGNNIYYENSYGDSEKFEYDKNGKLTYLEDSNGYWSKREYDDYGNEIYFETSDGDWRKFEYDDNGNMIYYETSNGEIYDRR